MRTPIRALLLAVVPLLALSGCFKADLDFEVNDDETIDGTYVFAISKDMEEQFGEDEDDPASESGLNAEALEEIGAEVETEPYEEGDWVGEKITFTGAPLDEFNALMSEDDPWSIERDGDGYRFEAGWTSEDLGVEESEGGDTEFDTEGMEDMMKMMMAQAEFEVSITFPGEITDTNGEVDGNTVTWDIDPTEPETELYAEAQPSGFPLVPVLAGVGGLLLVVILGLGALLLLRRRGSTPHQASETFTVS